MRIIVCLILLLLTSNAAAQIISIEKYYQLRDGNEWRYTAPPNWKEGDYVSRIVAAENGFSEFNSFEKIVYKDGTKAFRHYDATKAAKLLLHRKDGIYYAGEEFAGGESFAKFETPVLWFPAKIKIGESNQSKTNFTRIYKDGKRENGSLEIKQKFAALEDVTVTAGKFKKCLRVESESFWELGDGKKAKTISVYHYAKNVGVVKASARFIILDNNGKEIINRLVETDLKSATIDGKLKKGN